MYSHAGGEPHTLPCLLTSCPDIFKNLILIEKDLV